MFSRFDAMTENCHKQQRLKLGNGTMVFIDEHKDSDEGCEFVKER